jgi:drug/metabolite transporter (DMT)-like permease
LSDVQTVTGASRFPVRASHNTLAVAGALAAVYVFWGSTSPAIKVAVATVPPWFLVAIRFACAGGLLWLWARFRGVPLPNRRVWKGAALSGIVLLVLGNGTFSWCLQYIPSGIGALFFALCPLWNALIGAIFYKERLAPLAIAGILLGFGGMAYLVAPGGGENLPLFPTAVGIATSVAWSVGSMIQRRYPATDIAQMSGLQMLIACVFVTAIGALSGERLALAQFTPAATGALLFLIVFGSIVGFSAFVWVARSVPTVLASTYSYVNPIVALAIATFFLHEPLTPHTIIGAATVVAGVALMLLAPALTGGTPVLAQSGEG